MNSEISNDEQQEIVEIATNYFKKVTGNDNKAQELLSALARVVQDPGSKLIHIGNILFLILVRGEGVVEIHTIGEEKKPRDLAANFSNLSRVLKNLGVKVAYTYSEDEKFKKLAKMIDLKIKEYKAEHEGKKLNVFVVEL